MSIELLSLLLVGVVTGVAAGVLGIGGGLLMVPALMVGGLTILQATATSLVGVVLSATSGSLRNWRTGDLNPTASLGLALGGIPLAQVGAWLGSQLPGAVLAFCFAVLQLAVIYLMGLRRQLAKQKSEAVSSQNNFHVKTVGIGGLAGLLSGLFGVGGGAVMVPLQMLLLQSPIKLAVRTSLGAIVLIAISGLVRHGIQGNVLWLQGVCLGVGGILGAQLGTRVLPKLPERWVNLLFRLLLLAIAGYTIAKGLEAMPE
ncbi:sulfite exporter TauE/SafE family protein [Baaleninema sp.]|uniref:sulfite exporter TauE/SafE family protein n=1 Tax=Baaleninema sp. TaxID=3101197 RepID=UPI003D046A18